MFLDFYFLSTREYAFFGTETTYTVFDFVTAWCAQTGQSVWRAHPLFLLITDPALLQPCDRVAKQLFAYKLAPLHPVLKGELLRTASQLGRLADEGRAHHRCRSRKKHLVCVSAFGLFLHWRWDIHWGYCGATETFNETHQTTATADQTIRQRRCVNSSRDWLTLRQRSSHQPFYLEEEEE